MTLALSALPPLSLYIHIPWCVRKCPYCDFNSHTQKQSLPEQQYIEALIDDLSQQLPYVWGRSIRSIFIGGGTPSLFSAPAIERLLSRIRALLPFSYDIEITLEANPGTAEADRFKGFFDAGVNRLSIGVQSFDDDHLKRLGRIHSSQEALSAIEFARKAGFKRLNLDLMHGLPNQTLQQALQDLTIALAQGSDHLSWYQLTLEPNTLFYQQPPRLPEDDLLAEIQQAGWEEIADGGFEQYEVSAYARSPKSQSQHNLNYWMFGDYLAIGAGAHGKITLPAENRIVRYSQRRHPKDYLDPSVTYTDQHNSIEHSELPLEFMMNALRLNTGVPMRLFSERTGLPLSRIQAQLKEGIRRELLKPNPDWLATTDKGNRYLNDTLELFMSDVDDSERIPSITVD